MTGASLRPGPGAGWSLCFLPRCKAPVWRPGPPWVGSRSPDGWDQIPRWAGGRVLHQPPWTGVMGSIPKREELGKTGAPCVQVPGSSHRPRLVASRSTCPQLSPSPRANSFVIGTAVMNTHTGTVPSTEIQTSNLCHSVPVSNFMFTLRINLRLSMSRDMTA